MEAPLVLYCLGFAGALLMLVADLVLYYPEATRASADVYFARIDPAGTELHASPMASVSEGRLRLGAALGPVAAVLYALGFFGLYLALADGAASREQCAAAPPLMPLPAAAAIGFAGAMIVGAAYHVLFAHTGFIARELGMASDKSVKGPVSQSLSRLLASHQALLRFVYKFAATFGAVGAVAFLASVGAPSSRYAGSSRAALLAAVSPPMSAFAKKLVKRLRPGAPLGLAIAGGCTNWWNMVFFAAAGVLYHRPR